jgi:hypothetical protein
MDTNGLTTTLFAVALFMVFAATFLAGDIAGLVIEAQSARRWRMAAERMGFEFDGHKRKSHSLSELFLPTLIFPGAKETAFSYGQVMKCLKGRVQGFDLSISDFTVWDFPTRGPVIYRAVICVIRRDGIELPGPISLVKARGVLSTGLSMNETLKEYDFPEEQGFSSVYSLFGRKGSPPWVFTPDIRRFCLEHLREMDSLFVNEKELILIWSDKSPDRFPQLVELAVGIATKFVENVPSNAPFVRVDA